MMPDGVEQLCVVLDFTDFSLLTNPSFTMTMDVLNILTNHYPERLGLAMLYNPHWLFWSVSVSIMACARATNPAIWALTASHDT